MRQADVVIAGGGIVGLSLAFQLQRNGRSVTVLERGRPGSGASRAAAGMLAVHDPANPKELLPLAERSAYLYPEYLRHIEDAGGAPVAFETEWVLETASAAATRSSPDTAALLSSAEWETAGFSLHPERSLDPRRLFDSLLTAATQSGVVLGTGTTVLGFMPTDTGVSVQLENGCTILCSDFVDCTGAWSGTYAHPVKGQMLRVQLPPRALYLEGKGNVVVRTPDVYLVPRLDGSCLIGATVEHAGFDTEVHRDAVQRLRDHASRLLPAIASAPELESWSGLRPGTANGLPVLAAVAKHIFVANGLYRNGILLAPAVAEAMTALILRQVPCVDLAAFGPLASPAP